ncbi:MAG: M20 family metallopeptidase [Planctomycetaceae bacterium]|nr:M20 family metallopeptidase [Planctomycetaceae bacterium]
MDALKLASELVAVPSVSAQSNVDVSRIVQATLAADGFDVEWLEFDDPNGVRKANVIGRKGNGAGGVAYFAHTDTVPADSWSCRDHGPTQPTVRDDRLYGRGSCDMKGSLATFIAAASRLPAEQLRQPIYVVSTADEEVGYRGAADVVQRSELYRELVAGNARGLIGEPTELAVVHGHKGTYGFRAISRGRAAHSSTRDGVNANLAMIPFLAEMRRIHDETVADPQWQNAEFEPPWVSWNIGVNDHTHAVNITAPQSICTVYYRPMPGMDPDRLLERAQRAAAECGLDFEITWQAGPLYCDPQSAYIQELLQVTGQAKSQTVAYGTDGVLYSAVRQIAVLGPGSIRQAHTDDEWIALDQLRRGTDLYETLIRRWCA